MRGIKSFEKGKLLGHPIHAMLVHFPSALFPTSLVFDVLALLFHNFSFAIVGLYTLMAGLIMGVLAAFFGAIEYLNLPSNHPAWNKASLHGLLNIIWLILFAIVLGLRLHHFPQIELPRLSSLIIAIVSVTGLLISNYLGGELVYRHHVGSVE
jgi:uncharacterized membrane protein